jgi:putative spermidine/putrescine transport system substrate-binding protein
MKTRKFLFGHASYSPAELAREGAGIAFGILAAALLIGTAQAQDTQGLSVATWGGAYGQSQKIAYFDPFTQETGTAVTVDTYDGTLAAIKAKIEGDKSSYDVVDLSSASLDALCKDGLLEPSISEELAANAAQPAAADDFLSGALPSCGVASMAWAVAFVVDLEAFTKGRPTKIGDLIDLRGFPGKRALPNGPRYTLELALLADGVAPEQVYAELATPVGADRAFAALDKIKPEILWWDKAADPLAWLSSRKVAMAASYSGRIFRTAIGNPERMGLLWDGQIYDVDLWAIPKGAANKDLAKRFVAFASAPERLAAQARLIAYGPMRKSAVPLVGKNPEVGVEMENFLPTSPENFKNALRFDATWWTEHGEELTKRFVAWRDQPPPVESPPEKAKPEEKKPGAPEAKPAQRP